MLAATGMVLGACYLLWMLRKVLFGPLREPVPHAEPGGTISAAALGHTAVAPVGCARDRRAGSALVLDRCHRRVPPPGASGRSSPTVARIDQNTQTQGAIHVVRPAEVKPGSARAGDCKDAFSGSRKEREPAAGKNAGPAKSPVQPRRPA